MKYLILIVLLSSCSTITRDNKPFKIVQPFERAENCVERFLRLGVQPSDSNDICKSIHKGSK